MTNNFFNFLKETTLENFTYSQNEVFNHPNYNPYSDDINMLEDLLDKNKLTEAVEVNNINLILSPRVHLYKKYAYSKLNKTKEAQSELFLAQKIMQAICLTGDGSKEKPYKVTRISDEKDVLRYLEEEFETQFLLRDNGKIYDAIQCKSGKKIHFDITIPYSKMQDLIDNRKIESPLQKILNEKQIQNKKWWQFWK